MTSPRDSAPGPAGPGGDRHLFTVFTPTYNRAATLPRVYASLLAQTCRDFEWLLVDDGSTDDTAALVAAWAREAPFPVRYIRQPNRGKHVAFNRGVAAARGALFLTFDSDDACVPEALARFKHHWEAIPAAERGGFSAVTALCVDTRGALLGPPFPQDVLDSDSIEIETRYGARGERWGFQRTDVLRAFPFPELPDETFLTENLIWNRISRRYRTRFVNEPLQIHEYRPGGLTDASLRVRAGSPHGAALYYREQLDLPLPPAWRLRHLVNYLRFSFHARVGAARMLRAAGRRPLAAPLLPVGYLAYRRDRRALAATRV